MYLRSFLSKTGIIILISLILLANIYNSFRILSIFPQFLRTDLVTINESRLLPLKKYLSKNTEVGYISYTDNKKIFSTIEYVLKDEKASNKAIDTMAQLILAQYTLSPIFVYNRTDLPLIIGDFPKGLPSKDFFIKKHLIPVKNFPKGVILLRNEAK